MVDPTGAGDSFCGGFAAGLALGEDVIDAARRGSATAAAAIGAVGSLRLLDRVTIARDLLAGQDTAGAGTAGLRAGISPSLPVPVMTDRRADVAPVADDAYGIEVMRREIAMIPDVIAGQLADASGYVGDLADWLAGRGIEHLYLTGCGDSAFAGIAASLAFRRHSRLDVHALHALDLARYRCSLPAPGQCGAGDIFLRQGRPHNGGRGAGGRVRPSGHRADGQR